MRATGLELAVCELTFASPEYIMAYKTWTFEQFSMILKLLVLTITNVVRGKMFTNVSIWQMFTHDVENGLQCVDSDSYILLYNQTEDGCINTINYV